MATVTDVEVANASFPNVRQDLNDILEALATNFSADAEPTTMYPNQFWYETDTNLLKFRNEDNDAWITLAYFDQTNDEWEVRTAVIQAIDAAGLSFKTDEGTTRVEIADDGSVTVNTSLDVDNIKIDGNTISSTDTNGNINITPDGTGKVVIDGLSYPTADGSDGQVLTTDGSGNIAFEDAAGGGKVLQVVPGETTTNTQITSTSYNDTTLTATITPSSASSKILILVSQNVQMERNNYEINTSLQLLRDSTTISVKTVGLGTGAANAQGTRHNFVICHLDEPSTTSAITYKTQGKVNTTSDSGTCRFQEGGTRSEITLMEIAG